MEGFAPPADGAFPRKPTRSMNREVCGPPSPADPWPCPCPGMVAGGRRIVGDGLASGSCSWPSWTHFLPHAGHPLPAAAPGLPGDSGRHAGLPRYLAPLSGAPCPVTPSSLLPGDRG